MSALDYAERADVSLSTATRMLSYIDSESRETWLVVGAGLKDHFGDSAWPLWNDWSANAASYQPSAARATWKSFKAVSGSGRRASIGSVIHLAKLRGFQFDSTEARVVSEDEMVRRRADREAREKRDREAREREMEEAAEHASVTWARASESGDSPYLKRKLIERPEGVRFLNQWLIVPMMRYDMPEASALRGIQTIKPSGEKRFTKSMAKIELWGAAQQPRGVSVALGLPPSPDYDGPIVVGEGYATCASVRAACGWKYPVFAAFDKGGLLPAAHVIRARWPKSALLFAADDDYLTNGNPGVTAAKKAADSLKRATWMRPDFVGVPNRNGATDFNDLHILRGLGAVTACIVPALRLIERGRV
jgi:putative DNA primase/helicase